MAGGDSFDLVVVGGGILGMSHAAAAAARGLSVAVVDRSPHACGATVRNFGYLTAMYSDDGVWGKRADRTREIYAAWAADGGIPLTVTGSLQLVQSAPQLALARAIAAAVPHKARLVTADEARALCPALAAAAGGGRVYAALHFPDDALLEPRIMARALAAYLARKWGVVWVTSDAAVSVRTADGGGAVVVRTAGGRALVGRHAVLCTGDDICGLLPALLRDEAPKLTLVKLQMMRVALPRDAGPLTMPVTSGLTLRRYPMPGAVAPAEFAAMMAHDAEGADPAAEALGIHIIARPAPLFPRGAFGEIAHAAVGPHDALAQDSYEAIVGDSHQYAPLYGAGAGAFDETCDEAVTDEILRVTGTMLEGFAQLRAARVSGGGGGGGGGGGAAKMASQWSGVYMQHSDGVLCATVALAPEGDGGYTRLAPEEVAARARAGGLVHVVTGIGGKGMTMSPALGEEGVAALFPQ